MHKLVICDDEGKTTVVPLVRDEVTIGRKEGNTIRLTERNVSRRHARLRQVDGSFVLHDLQSYNGVLVNGERIEKEAPLNSGDQITIGDYLLALQAEAPGETASAPGNGASTAAIPGASTAATQVTPTTILAAPTRETAPARLVMLSPPAPGAEFALTRQVLRIGRAEDLDVWVNHRSISREHAEVLRDGDNFHIGDLGSANGVRVNGRDASTAPLKSGDVVELGQVRFRFVGAGETYTFDGDRTVQLEALTMLPTSPRAKWFLMAGGLAVTTLTIAVVALLMPDSKDESIKPEATVQRPASPSKAPAAQSIEPALTACRDALRQGRYEDAVSQAAGALRIEPTSRAARQCESKARGLLADRERFEAGVTALRAGDVEGAYATFQNLGLESPFRQRPEVSEASEGLANKRLDEASEGLNGSPGRSKRLAEQVLQMSGLSGRTERRARNLQARAQRALAASPRPATSRPQPNQRRPRPAAGTSRFEEAQRCLQMGDQRCALKALEGRASSQRELALLIETYRTIGDRGKMLRSMRRFVDRYPSARQTQNYRQILNRYGQ